MTTSTSFKVFTAVEEFTLQKTNNRCEAFKMRAKAVPALLLLNVISAAEVVVAGGLSLSLKAVTCKYKQSAISSDNRPLSDELWDRTTCAACVLYNSGVAHFNNLTGKRVFSFDGWGTPF